MELVAITLTTLLAGAVQASPVGASGTPSYCMPVYQAYQDSRAPELEALLLRDCASWYRAVRERQAKGLGTSDC